MRQNGEMKARDPPKRNSRFGGNAVHREAKMTTVNAILAGKGREVVNMEPNASLASAVALLAERRIGAVLILGADRRIVGILSERDIVRALAERGSAALGEPVSQTMTRKVSTCAENETVASIMERMTAVISPSSIRAGRSGSFRSATWSSIACTRWNAIPRRCTTTS
jgi:CBS domain-containing protein